jgi:hypothetical protein
MQWSAEQCTKHDTFMRQEQAQIMARARRNAADALLRREVLLHCRDDERRC